MKMNIGIVIGLSTMLLISCNSNSGKKPVAERDTPVSGKIEIVADNSYKNLIDSEVTVFNAQYTDAHINVTFKPDAAVVQSFLNDSARLIVLGRQLSSEEVISFRRRNYDPKETRVALDAIAVIVNNATPIDKIDMGMLYDLLTGKKSNWQQISPKSSATKVSLVMDSKGSGVFKYLQDSVLKGAPVSSNVYAVNTNEEVIDYVAANPGSMGFIGVNHISDMTDQKNQQFLKKVKLLDIAKSDVAEGYKPYQAFLATRQYPMVRIVHIYINEPYNGLGSGFSAFVASDVGQRIVLKDGLVPATMPIRLIQMNPTTSPIGN
ncbi:MAG TPA: substrate-binding domain-containing protein [Saprospiraceae bacterium]|nr:substrate-binding domain-containing protein [Saprospiraceae bacterium]HQW55293.1 substrate-binding domain-containing protein [Saprospiraceae bacterium]